jgi:hypothetical protein
MDRYQFDAEVRHRLPGISPEEIKIDPKKKKSRTCGLNMAESQRTDFSDTIPLRYFDAAQVLYRVADSRSSTHAPLFQKVHCLFPDTGTHVSPSPYPTTLEVCAVGPYGDRDSSSENFSDRVQWCLGGEQSYETYHQQTPTALDNENEGSHSNPDPAQADSFWRSQQGWELQ